MTDSHPLDPAPARPAPRDWNDPQPPEEGDTKIKWSNWAVAAGVLVVAFLVIGLWPVRLPDPTRHPAVGHPLSDLRLEGLIGTQRPVRSKDLPGRVVIVSFWSSTDPESARMLSHLLRLGKQLEKREDFTLLLVAYQPQASLTELRNETAAFLESGKVEVPTYWDPDDATLTSVMAFGQTTTRPEPLHLPVTLLLDRDTTIRGAWYGYTSGVENQIGQMTTALLAGSQTLRGSDP